jgi:hypothetical protein
VTSAMASIELGAQRKEPDTTVRILCEAVCELLGQVKLIHGEGNQSRGTPGVTARAWGACWSWSNEVLCILTGA